MLLVRLRMAGLSPNAKRYARVLPIQSVTTRHRRAAPLPQGSSLLLVVRKRVSKTAGVGHCGGAGKDLACVWRRRWLTNVHGRSGAAARIAGAASIGGRRRAATGGAQARAISDPASTAECMTAVVPAMHQLRSRRCKTSAAQRRCPYSEPKPRSAPEPVPRYNPPFGLWPSRAAHVQEDC